MRRRRLIRFTAMSLACLQLVLIKGGASQGIEPRMNVSEEYLKAAADQERAALGLVPLRVDASLVVAARRHAVMMVDHNSISHKYPDEPDLAARAAAEGAKFSLITENVAQAPSALTIHSAWMHSEGHRHNLLDPNVDSVGISVIERNGQMFAVEDFARSVAQLSVQRQEDVVADALRRLGLNPEPADEDAYRTCMGERNAGAEHASQFVMRYTTADLGQLPDQLVSRVMSGRYAHAKVAACSPEHGQDFSMYRLAILLYR